jgi:hypothetical protein
MKKAQAALEFLTTYGWAFLVILVMIGALAYFGILSPSRFLPERCNVGPEFTCNEYMVDNTGLVKIRFTNNIGETIEQVRVTRVVWTQEEFSTTSVPPITVSIGGAAVAKPAALGDCNIVYNGDAVAINARGGDPIEVACQFTQGNFPPIGQKMKFNFDINYIPQGKTYTKPIAAEIYTALQ